MKIFAQPLVFALKGIPHAKYGKKSISNANFFTFFTTLDLIQFKFYPRPHPLCFFTVFQRNMLGDLVDINNFNWNPVVLKTIC